MPWVNIVLGRWRGAHLWALFWGFISLGLQFSSGLLLAIAEGTVLQHEGFGR
jgi:hypothetical protein